MTEQNELYVKSQERWIKEQELLIEMLEENKRNSENMISIHSRTLEVTNDSLEHELNALSRTKELFEEWKKK
jgi:hypothetical protein